MHCAPVGREVQVGRYCFRHTIRAGSIFHCNRRGSMLLDFPLGRRAPIQPRSAVSTHNGEEVRYVALPFL